MSSKTDIVLNSERNIEISNAVLNLAKNIRC